MAERTGRLWSDALFRCHRRVAHDDFTVHCLHVLTMRRGGMVSLLDASRKVMRLMIPPSASLKFSLIKSI
jgi:hypothetical protein